MNIYSDPRITHSATLTRAIPEPNSAKDKAQLRESAREMEAMYIFQMYAAMRKNVPDNGLLPQSSTSKTFQEMLDMELARDMASGNGIGIGEAIYNQLKDKI